MGLAKAAVFAGCLLLFLAVDASGNKCTVGCHGMHGGKAYQEGHTYVYDLEGTSVTSVPDAQGDATLKLKGAVELSVKPDCIRQVRLKGISINGAPILLPDVEKYALQFNYHDGHIDTEICTEAGDSQVSLNIKRAVTSLFQSAVIQDSGSTTHHEFDVLGGCPTDFTFHKDGDSLVIQKERDLIRCSHRESIKNGPVSAIYDQKSDIQSAPLLSSHQRIEQRFKRGILNKATSVETYKLKPWSNGGIGAKTIVQTTLTLKGEKDDSPTAPVSQPKSLIFEAPHPVIKSSADSIAIAVKAANAEEHNSVKHEAAERFAELVKVLRFSSKNDILEIYQKIKTGNGFDKVLDKKIYLDALFRTGSGEAAEVVVDLLKSHEVTGVQALMFYASLALVNHVNLPSVTAVTSLLDQPNLPRLGYLGIGQVIGKYCQEHTCENVAEVKQAIHKIREKVGNGKAKTREQENLIVSAMKALGNSKYLDDVTLQKLVSIAEDKNVRNRVRVAAIEALPTRCSMKWKNILLKVLGDREEDSEIRIKSYLSLVACPCPHVAGSLKEILDKETINQVGSFIQSHLRNLRASADPNKAEAKKHLSQIKSRTKFPEDFRKFSFNNELSYNVGGIGVGSSAESNVIYSQNSFVPRSLNLNMTSEVFGRSFNFLELNTRIENFDRLLEQYFGPKGRLTQDVEDLVEKGTEKAQNIAEYIQQKVNKLRSKREVKQGELDKFAKGVKLRNNEVDQQLDLDLSVKLFGVELAYLTYDGNPTQFTPEHIVDKIFDNLEGGFNKMKKFDYHLQDHMQFLDAEVVYPTNLGMALSVSVIGTSVVHIKTYGGIDIPAIIKNPNSADVRFGLEPSASIRVAGNMVVKGFDVESGMKLVSTLHTNTATDITVKLLDGKGIDIVVSTPKKKEEPISFSSEILLSFGDTYKAPKFGKGKVYKDCFEQLSSILGITVCGHLEFPYDGIDSVQKRALFPLNGPSKFSISYENNDLSSVHFKLYYDKSPKSRSFEILLETPNSKTNRRMSFIAEAALEPNKHAKLSFDSPFKKASIEAIIKEDPQERSLTVTIHNDNQEYFARAGLLANGPKYKPILEYKVPEHIEKLAGTKSGLKTSRGGQQYEMQGTVEMVDHDGGKKYVFDNVALVAGDHKLVGLDGYIHSAEDAAGLDMKVNYGDESIALKLQAKKKQDRYSISVSALPSKDPNIGFNIQLDLHRELYAYKSNLIFIHGPDQDSKINRFSLEHHAIAKPNQDGLNFIVGASTKISYPAIKLKLELVGKARPNSVEGEIGIAYDKFKFGSKLSAEQNKDKVGDYEVDFEAELLQNSIKLESKRTVIDAHKSKYKNKLELVPGGKYEANALVTYDHDKNNKRLNFEVDSDLKLDDKKINIFGSLNAERPNNIQSRANIIVSDIKYVDFLFKLQQQQGSLTLNVKNYLNVAGQMSIQDGKGNGQIYIDLPKINRKIKGTGDLTVTGTQHKGDFELLFDAEKDPSKYIKLSTVSDIKKNAIDSKNVIEIMSHKFELNGKGKLDSTMENDDLTVEADITLPNGRYVVSNVKYTSKKNDNNKYTIYFSYELEDHETKGGKSRKLTYFEEYNDFDYKTFTFWKIIQLKAVDFNGNNGQIDAKVKNLRDTDGHKKVQAILLNLSGSHISRPFNLEYEYNENDNGERSYKGACSCGKDFLLKSSENFIPGNDVDKPCTIKGNVELKLPSEKLRNVKFDYAHDVLIQSETGGVIDLKGSTMLTYNDDKSVKIENAFKSSGIIYGEHPYESDLQLDLIILKTPISLHDHFKYEPHDDKVTITGNTIIKYDQKEMTFEVNPLIYNHDLTHIDVKAKATTPYEKMHSIDLELKHEREKNGHVRKTDAALTLDNEKYTLKSEIREGNISPMMHIIFTCPGGKTELLSKFDKLGDHEYTGEWKVETPKGFAVADAHVNLDSIDNFVINVNLDSDKLKHRKLHAEIANRPTAKTGRRIVITVTSDGKNIVTGSTNYKKRDEAGKTIIEGSGNLKIGEDTRSSSFKYTRQQLTHEKDGESGMVIVLNAKFDPAAVVGELKLSNKEILVFNSYCEQSKDCAHFKLQSSYDTDNKNYLNHDITVEVDLKKFNVPAEFGLKTSTEIKDSKFDHSANLYLHSSKDKSQYSYKVYVHPKESAAILTLPNRELAVIGTFDLPKTKQTGAFKVDVSLYLDRKNKPSDKTALIANGDVNIEKDSGSVSGEIKFIYPSQPKDMAMKGKLHYGGEHLLDANLDIDVFAKKTQKINVVAKLNRQNIEKGYNVTSVIEVNSRGQQLKVDLKSHIAISDYKFGFGSILSYTDIHQKPKSVGVLFEADSTEAYILVAAPNKELLKVDTKMQLKKNLQKFDADIMIVGNKPIVINFEAHDWNSFTFSEYHQDNPNTKIVANGRVVLGQLAEIHADAFKDGVKKNLFHSLIHLDEEKFLKPDFGYNKDNVVYAIERLRSRNIELLKQLKEASNEIISEVERELKALVEHLKKAQPNIKPLLDYYDTELNKLKNELHADQTIKDIQTTFNKHFGAIITAIVDTMKQVMTRLNELQKEYTEVVSRLEDVWKTIYPQLKESYNKIVNAYINFIDSAADVSMTYLKTLLAAINEHQKELKEIAVMASELAQDVAKIIFKAVGQIRKDVEEFVLLLNNQMKALPIFDIAKEQYKDIMKLQIPEPILASIHELNEIIKAMLPTEELRQLFSATYEYIMKHVKHEKVDNTNEIKKIYDYALNAIASIIKLVESNGSINHLINELLEAHLPVEFETLAKLPTITSFKMSLVNLLRNNELPSPMDFYYTYRPTLVPSDIIPPFSKFGVVIDGGHFFTFDGNHFSMPGDCTYILAQDMQDGNFSVIGNFNKGNLVSVTVTEPKESITLKNNGNILVNNKPADFPASTKNLHAFLVWTMNVKSDYGVHVLCSYKKAMLCIVRVSGFYHGKLRGLLGDGNNECYDDYTLPSGKITESETEFANGYKLKPDCAAVNAIDHKTKQRNPVCTEYFSGQKSTLKNCFNYVNPTYYRDACDAAANGNPQAPCLLATAYYASCYDKRVFQISIPPACTNCKNGADTIAVDDSFSVKTPKNQADIILTVEQVENNEKVFKDLIPTLITDLREEMKQHGITDVHIALIGFGEHMKWPQHYTTNGNTNIEGEVKNMKFAKPDPILTFEEAKKGDTEKQIKYLEQRLNLEFGTFQLTRAYEEAINYPFRPGAVKAVVGIFASPCEKSPLPLSLQQLRLIVGQKIYRDMGLTYYHVYYTNDIQASGKAQKNIVGYDSDSVYVFADNKKKPLSGNTDLRNNIVLPTVDVCADFAVASGGAAFSSSNLVEAKPNQKRQFAQVTARKITEDLTNVELEKDCVCESFHGLERARCKIVERKEKEQLARHTKGGVKG